MNIEKRNERSTKNGNTGTEIMNGIRQLTLTKTPIIILRK